jgi:hypothetical protein
MAPGVAGITGAGGIGAGPVPPVWMMGNWTGAGAGGPPGA